MSKMQTRVVSAKPQAAKGLPKMQADELAQARFHIVSICHARYLQEIGQPDDLDECIEEAAKWLTKGEK